MQNVFDYGSWDKFTKVIEKAKISCKNNGINIIDHFSHVGKMVSTGTVREINELKLTRYACYLIAQNGGDPRKSKIAFAQNYFAVQTRKFELIIERMDKVERIEARVELKESEKEFCRVSFERGIRDKDFGILKSEGDKAFFGGHNTQQMKDKLKIPPKRVLQDFTPKSVVLGKSFANQLTTETVIKEDKNGLKEIKDIHVDSNMDVRQLLIKRGIYPENISPAEDIKKIEKEINAEEKKLISQSKKLSG